MTHECQFVNKITIFRQARNITAIVVNGDRNIY